MIKLPGRTYAGPQQASVSVESVLPTILDILRLESADAVFSAAPLSWAWQADGADPRTPLVSTGTHFFEDRISVVFGAMKYIHSLASETDELFDLSRDLEEKTSLARDRPDFVDEAHRLIDAHGAQSLQIRQLLGFPTATEGVLDPAVLEQLRALGYIQ
jgi:arylsulfatase A-like enzyme